MEDKSGTNWFEGRSGRAFLITLICLAILAIVFIVFAVRASGTISRDNNAILALQKQATADSTHITSLKNQVASDASQMSSLKDQVTSLQSQVTSLQSQVTSDKSQISSLQGQITSLQNNVSSLQSQNANLQSIVNLQQSSVKLSLATINQGGGAVSPIAAFKADYAGYVTVTGTSTSQTGFLRITDSYGGYPYNDYEQDFVTGKTLLVPVLPGDITISFGNHNDFGLGATATLTVTYVY